MCDGHLNAKEERRLMDDCARWAKRAERAEAEVRQVRSLIALHQQNGCGVQLMREDARCHCGHLNASCDLPALIDGPVGANPLAEGSE